MWTNCKQRVSSMICFPSVLCSKQPCRHHGYHFLFTRMSTSITFMFPLPFFQLFLPLMCNFRREVFTIKASPNAAAPLSSILLATIENEWALMWSHVNPSFFTDHKYTMTWVLRSPWVLHLMPMHPQLQCCCLLKINLVDTKIIKLCFSVLTSSSETLERSVDLE